jgi:hypothetical protein
MQLLNQISQKKKYHSRPNYKSRIILTSKRESGVKISPKNIRRKIIKIDAALKILPKNNPKSIKLSLLMIKKKIKANLSCSRRTN